jgi:hypothetical protein
MAVWGVNFAVTKVVLAELGVWPFLFIRAAKCARLRRVSAR